MLESVQKHLRIYVKFFTLYMKSRLVYKADFVLGFFGQLINIGVALAFLTLIFTQVETIYGWTFNEMLFLAGIGGFIMNLHHVFFFAIYSLGRQYIVRGRLDRLLVRPLNPLFQVYADYVADDNISKLIANAALVVYASSQLGITLLTPAKILYGIFAAISGVLIFASIYLTFATTAFWTGRSRAAMWLIFQMSDFRKYPFGIYMMPVQVVLVTFIPIAFASFFPATYFLGMNEWGLGQLVTPFVGPIAFLIAYKVWSIGLSNYSSTGS